MGVFVQFYCVLICSGKTLKIQESPLQSLISQQKVCYFKNKFCLHSDNNSFYSHGIFCFYFKAFISFFLIIIHCSMAKNNIFYILLFLSLENCHKFSFRKMFFIIGLTALIKIYYCVV